jgi:hypothetical protein
MHKGTKQVYMVGWLIAASIYPERLSFLSSYKLLSDHVGSFQGTLLISIADPVLCVFSDAMDLFVSSFSVESFVSSG